MKYLSVCSGIEAATVAWHPLGWQAVGYSEIEKFPSQVLAHHYPDVTNYGDMTKFKEWNLESNIDVFVGGTPCQSFSVAGLRKGLDDPRGNLMLTYLAIARQYRPRWLVWENVPGVLSSNGGLDFASLLRGMGECGYGFAYRVLDAQYFGVAQRRRRVFVVGYLGDWRLAAAVLFERHSLSRNIAPSRETGKSSSKYAGRGIAECSPTIGCELAKQVNNQMIGNAEAFYIPDPIALAENTIGRQPQNGGNGDGFTDGGPMYTLNATGVHGVAQPIPLNSMNCFRSPDADASTGCGIGEVGEAMFTITKTNSHAVAQPIGFESSRRDGVRLYDGISNTLQAFAGTGGGNSPMVAQPMAYNIAPGKGILKNDIHVTNADATKTLDASGSNPAMHQGGAAILQQMAVRRLTPKECERLQGFPDNYTDIEPKGKPTPDGPRYKALGNSMAVPVMAWIGKRIQEVERLSERNG